jgi:hypothetical protein
MEVCTQKNSVAAPEAKREKKSARSLVASILPGFPKELRLMLDCLRGFFSATEGSEPEMLRLDGIDWKTFISLAYHHRVVPILHAQRAILRAKGCPEDVLQGLAEASMRNVLRNGAMTGELLQLSDILERNHVPMIAIKGIPQAILLYGGIQYRSPGDIDVLVSPDSMGMAHQALCNAGYVPQSRYSASPLIQTISKLLVNHTSYRNKNNQGHYVELHSRLYFYRSVLSLDFDSILASSQEVNIGCCNVQTLSDDLTVIFLLAHGALHAWHRLFWVCDTAQLFHGHGPLNWASLMDMAAKLGVARSVASGLILSNRLLGSPLPEVVSLFAERDSMVEKLVHYVIVQLGGSHTKGFLTASLRESSYVSSLGSSFRYKTEVILTAPVTSGLIARCWDRLIGNS